MGTTARAHDILNWYDGNARVLPWRVGPQERAAGVAPDPYRVWMSEIMLQQTTVAVVKGYFETFTKRWPDVATLADADDDAVMAAWAGLGYYARARNLLKCARVVAQDFAGQFPHEHKTLLSLPGIGPYTAAAIGAIAFERPEVVVDGNVERVMARLHAHTAPLPGAKAALTEYARALTPMVRPGDYAQAVMDLGATICTPKNPTCGLCPWRSPCRARAEEIAADLPRKTPKAPKPTRHGVAYLARRADGAWLLERRPEKGLLGGMLGWPGSDWSAACVDDPPLSADWQRLPEEVRHTFTHFHLRLAVCVAKPVTGTNPTRGSFIAAHEFCPEDLPTVMRKAYDVAQCVLSSD